MFSPLRMQRRRAFFVFLLAQCHNTNLVEHEEEHVQCVNCEEYVSLPLLEFTLNDGGNNYNRASRNAYGEVKYEVDLVYRECLAVDNCAQGKNEGGIDDVCTNDVTNRERIFLFADSSQG